MAQDDTQPLQLPLEGLRVGISGSIPEEVDWGGTRDLDQVILACVSQLAAFTIKWGGHVVHGSQPAFASVIGTKAREASGAGERNRRVLTLVASQLWGADPPVAFNAAKGSNAAIVLTPVFGSGDARDPQTRNKSLTAMRLALVREMDVLVAIGGKLQTDTGFSPGVLEELAYARWHGVPAFVLGGFGGATAALDREIIAELQGAGLPGASDRALDMASARDTLDEYIGVLLSDFARHRQQLIGGPKNLPDHAFHTMTSYMRDTGSELSVVHVQRDLVENASRWFNELAAACDAGNVDAVRALFGRPPRALPPPEKKVA